MAGLGTRPDGFISHPLLFWGLCLRLTRLQQSGS
jgi:hypothetical protein